MAPRPHVAQSWNAWTSYAYVFLGFVTLFGAPRLSAQGLFAPSMGFLGVSSFLFHASVTCEMQWADVMGMYLVLVALSARALSLVSKVPTGWLVALALVADVVLAELNSHLSPVWTIAILGGVVLALALLVANVQHRSARPLLWPIALLAAAFGCHFGDKWRVWGAHHAVWHLLTAAALYEAYRFLRPADAATDARGHAMQRRD